MKYLEINWKCSFIKRLRKTKGSKPSNMKLRLNKKVNKTYPTVIVSIPVDHRNISIENESLDKYQQLIQEWKFYGIWKQPLWVLYV